jgi:hypothetical protein
MLSISASTCSSTADFCPSRSFTEPALGCGGGSAIVYFDEAMSSKNRGRSAADRLARRRSRHWAEFNQQPQMDSHVDATVFEVEDIPSRHRQMVMTSNCGDLPIGYAHRKSEFLAIAHQLTVDAGCRVIVGKYTLVEGHGDESFESFSEP